MEKTIIAILGFLSGLFLASHREWFSHNLKLDRERKKMKTDLYRKFAIDGANVIEKTLLILLDGEKMEEREIEELKIKAIKTFYYFEELKLFALNEVFEKASEFLEALIEFYEMFADLLVLIEHKKIRGIEFCYFLFSTLGHKSFKNRIEDIRQDESVHKDTPSFLEKYSAKDCYFTKVSRLHTETIKLMKREI